MKNLILIAILTLPSLASAQSLINIYCHECRDLANYPEDARNFSYNQVFGSSSWLTLDQADRFKITDSFGNTVTIDMNAELQINLFAADLFELGNMGQLLVDDLVVQIRVIYQNLDIVEYLFTLKDVPGDCLLAKTTHRAARQAVDRRIRLARTTTVSMTPPTMSTRAISTQGANSYVLTARST